MKISMDQHRRERDAWNRIEVLWKRVGTLRAVRDEIEGNESEAEALVISYKQVRIL